MPVFRRIACLACLAGCCMVAAHQLNIRGEAPAAPCGFEMPCDRAQPLADEPPPQRGVILRLPSPIAMTTSSVPPEHYSAGTYGPPDGSDGRRNWKPGNLTISVS
jgi:hypothetical protein